MDEMENLIGRPPSAKPSSNSNVDHLASHSEDDMLEDFVNDDDDMARSDDPAGVMMASNKNNITDSVTLPPETVAPSHPLIPSIPADSSGAYIDTPAFNAPQ